MSELEEIRQKIEEFERQLGILKHDLEEEKHNSEFKTKKQLKRFKEIEQGLESITNLQLRIANYYKLKDIPTKLDELATPGKVTKAREESLNQIIEFFEEFKNSTKEEYEKVIDTDTYPDVSEVLTSLQTEIKTLKDKIAISKRINLDVKDEEKELEQKMKDFVVVENYFISENIDIDQLKSLNEKLGKNSTAIKKSIIEKYKGFAILIEKNEGKNILNAPIDINKENTKSKAKALLSKLNSKLNNKPLKTGIVSGIATIILGIALIAAAKEITANINRDNSDDYNPDHIADVIIDEEKNDMDNDTETVNLITVKKLEDIGYSRNSAILIARNFSAEAINDLLARPYVPAVENYIYTTGFMYKYLEDYESARTTLNINPDQAIDYVNRGYELKNRAFFSDLSINEVAEILRAIDTRDKDVDVIDPIYSNNNQIVTDFFFASITDEDLSKVSALPYLSKENSDINNFLKQYSTLITNIMKNPNDENAYNAMQQYIGIFARNIFNAQHSDPETLSNDQQTNDNAIISDHYDWIVVRGIINSMIEIAYPYPYEDERYSELQHIQELMDQALALPEFQEYCGESRKLN